ncbi:ExbD/TolR family protein [Anatilimnocola aggregata]|nr:biopolymer transporter ExbD [Anatilimnocola aggregata]
MNKLLVEPAAVATGDIAFNLIVFFLVCASTQPDRGRKQDIPSSQQTKTEQKQENTEILVTKSGIVLNGAAVRQAELPGRLATHFKGKPRPEDRVVVIKTRPDTPYENWISVTSLVQDAGGSITIQREEERTVTVGN